MSSTDLASANAVRFTVWREATAAVRGISRKTWIAFGLGVAIAVVYAIAALLRLRAAYGLNFDLGFYLQQIWLLSNGLSDGSLANLPVFADHLSPILYAFAPFAASSFLASALVVTQAIAVGIAAWALLARDGLSSTRTQLIVATYFCLAPALGYALLFDFHPVILGLPVLASILYRLESGTKYAWLGLLLAVALLIREDIALLAGLMVLMQRREKAVPRWVRGVALLTLGVATTYAILASASLGAYSDSPVGIRYAWIADLPRGDWPTFSDIVSLYALSTIAIVFFPIALFPQLVKERVTWLALILSGFFIAGDFVPADSIYYQYQATPVLLMAWSLGTVTGRSETSTLSGRGLLAIAVLNFFLFSPFSLLPPPVPIQDRWVPHVVQHQDRAVLSGIGTAIPEEASVSASNTVGAFVAQRNAVYDFPDPLSCEGVFTPSRGSTSYVDYVVVTDSEATAEDIGLIEGLGYEPHRRVDEATIYRAPEDVASLPRRSCPPHPKRPGG